MRALVCVLACVCVCARARAHVLICLSELWQLFLVPQCGPLLAGKTRYYICIYIYVYLYAFIQ